MARRRFTPEFKRSAVALVVEQNYTRQQAAQNLALAWKRSITGCKNIAS